MNEFEILQLLYGKVTEEEFFNGTVVIGLSDIGPARVPVLVENETHATEIFGSGSSLTNACVEALTYPNPVIGIRVNGKHATYDIKNSEGDTLITLYAVGGGAGYNNVSISIEKDTNTILNVFNTSGIKETMVTAISSLSIDRIVALLNYASLRGECSVVAILVRDGTADDIIAVEQTNLTGGDDEASITNDEKAEYLSQIYAYLETYDFGVLCNMTFNAFDQYGEGQFLYAQLAEFCNKKETSNTPIIAILQIEPYDPTIFTGGYDDYVAHIDALHTSLTSATNLNMYISICDGGYRRMNAGTRSYTDYLFAPLFAAAMNNLSVGISPLALGFPYINILNPLPTETCRLLQNEGIISLCNAIRRGCIISGDCTSLPSKTIKDVLLANTMKQSLYEIIDLHEGDPIPISGNALDSKIETYLKSLVSQNIISKYKYTVNIDKHFYDEVKGRYVGLINIDVEAVPFGTVDVVSTSLKAGF